MAADTGHFNRHGLDSERRIAGEIAVPVGRRPGVTAAPGARHLILVVIFKPWRLRFPQSSACRCSVWPGVGGDELSLLLIDSAYSAGVAVALEFTGPLAVALFGSRRPLDFVWVALAVLGLWFLLPLGQDVAQVDLTGALLALGAGACWAVYILTGQRAGEEHGPATVAMGSLIAAVVFVPLGMRRLPIRCSSGRCCRWGWHRHPLYGAALLSGNDCPHPYADPHIRHADEHGAGARRAIGHDLSGRNADLYQTLALGRLSSPRWAPR
jgi:inner membrane transporter RhtA